MQRGVRGAHLVTQAELDWVEGEVRAGRGLYSVAKQTGRAEATYRRYLYGSRRVPAPGEWSPPRRRSVPLARSQQQENEDRQE